MRVPGLIMAGMLALAAPIAGHAAPSGSSMKQLVPASGIVQVWGGCGWGWHPVHGHWSRWRGEWVPPHCAPNHYYGGWGPYGRWGPYGAGQGPYGVGRPYGDWGGPYQGWYSSGEGS
jgi:hypothetical protein